MGGESTAEGTKVAPRPFLRVPDTAAESTVKIDKIKPER